MPQPTRFKQRLAESDHIPKTNHTKNSTNEFWHLWLRHQPRLKKLSLKWMNYHQANAEDALTQAMIKAFGGFLRQPQKIKNIEAWLTTIVFRTCMDSHRKKKTYLRSVRKIQASYHLDDRVIESLESSNSEKSVSDLETLLEILPPRLKETAKLKFFLQWPYSEIAQQLNITQTNARKRVQQARAILRRHVDA